MINIESIFLDKIEKTDSCWEWIGIKNKGGYGQIHCRKLKKRNVLAHRFSWEFYNGDIPSELKVLHKCDNRGCVNPSHLFLGTQSENIKDMMDKKRDKHPSKEDNGKAKITEDIVTKMKNMRKTGATYKEIGDVFNIHLATARSAIIGKTWR
jgi:hypothetical protein